MDASNLLPTPLPFFDEEIAKRLEAFCPWRVSDDELYALFLDARTASGNGYRYTRYLHAVSIYIYEVIADCCRHYPDIDALYRAGRQAASYFVTMPAPMDETTFFRLLHARITNEVWEVSRQYKEEQYDLIRGGMADIHRLNDKLKQAETQFVNYFNSAPMFLSSITGWRLLVFSNNEKCHKQHNIALGEPISIINCWQPKAFINQEGKQPEADNRNWNKLKDTKHPLASCHFCYTIHVLVFQAMELSWNDLLNIDDVKIEVRTDFLHTTPQEEK